MNRNVSKITVYFSTSIINALVSLLSSVILTRIFTKEIYGALGLFNSAASLFMGVFCLGFDAAYIRFFYERPNEDSEQLFLKKCLFFPFLFFFFFSVIVNIFFRESFSEKIIGIQNNLVTLLFCFNVFAQLILRFLNLNYRLRGKIKSYAVQSIATQIFLRFFVITAAFVSLKIQVILAFNSIGIFLLTLIYIIIQFKDVLGMQGRISFLGYRRLIRFAFFSSPTYIIIYLNTYLTQRIIVHNLGLDVLGIYSAASLFIFALTVFSSGFTTFWGPYFYKNYKEKQLFISKIHEVVVLFSLVFFIGLLSCSDILYLFIGKEFRHNKEIIGFLLIYPILNLLSETTSYGINIANRNYIFLISNGVYLFLNVLLGLTLSKKIGILGIALSSSISAVIFFVINTLFGQKFYKTIQKPLKSIINITFFIVIASCYYLLCYRRSVFLMIITGVLFLILLLNRETCKYIYLSLYNYVKGIWHEK